MTGSVGVCHEHQHQHTCQQHCNHRTIGRTVTYLRTLSGSGPALLVRCNGVVGEGAGGVAGVGVDDGVRLDRKAAKEASAAELVGVERAGAAVGGAGVEGVIGDTDTEALGDGNEAAGGSGEDGTIVELA